ncbi:hypothetical protein G2W53_010477 [Senna tora]|uniref:RNase H type-1 domain-containing protein n=1 Tax=Senna tora TaxID=362788 RepID=A0A834X139_9FABA|nr:hypothetical protein G2W53_010477 [Senna tora]
MDASAPASPVAAPLVPPLVGWRPPAEGWVKGNVDGSFFGDEGSAGLGVIFRDHQGSVIDGCCAVSSASSSFMVEAFAVRRALLMASDLQIDKLVIESDCQVLVSSVDGSGAVPADWLAKAAVRGGVPLRLGVCTPTPWLLFWLLM